MTEAQEMRDIVFVILMPGNFGGERSFIPFNGSYPFWSDIFDDPYMSHPGIRFVSPEEDEVATFWFYFVCPYFGIM